MVLLILTHILAHKTFFLQHKYDLNGSQVVSVKGKQFRIKVSKDGVKKTITFEAEKDADEWVDKIKKFQDGVKKGSNRSKSSSGFNSGFEFGNNFIIF